MVLVTSNKDDAPYFLQISYAWSETCSSASSECRHTTCDSCTSLQDCSNVADWDCTQNRRHCIDNILNGTNSIESFYDEATHYRTNQTYQENYKTSKLELTGKIKAPPPHNVTVAKGSAYGTFSRSFVEFALRNPKARDILKWTEDTLSPDETFWATLAFNKDLGAPGIQHLASGVPNPKSWITVGVMWESKGPAREVCHGMYVRNICVFGLGDLNKIVQEKTLFINKFYHYYQPFALMCMEEWYFNKTFTTVPFESYYYNRLIKP
uniref:N-acetyllactosaminide beta-1,6-N-acetylglucosaminyl-transferase n=1 Tax=Magallana gigas TaxID=29159 RepID=K1Q3I5_MAGGI